MKRIIERLFFLLVGAMIAAVGYTLGHTESRAQQDIDVFDTVVCRQIQIMDNTEEIKMTLTTQNGDPFILLKGKEKHYAILTVDDDMPRLSMGAKEGKKATGFFFPSARKELSSTSQGTVYST